MTLPTIKAMPTFQMASAAVITVAKRSPLSLLMSHAPRASCAPVRNRMTPSIAGGKMRRSDVTNGAGFHQPAGSGVRLANTRERLATFYGASGRLHFGANDEGGITAAIELPDVTARPESVSA